MADARNEIFSATGMREVFKRSGGIPRLVNLIGDRALLGAYTLGKNEVDRKIVRRAAVELKGSGVGAKTSLNLKSIGIGGLLIVLLGGGAWHLLRQGAPKIDVRSGFSLLGTSKSSDTPSIATESSGSFEQSGAPEPLPFQFTEGKDEALKHLFGLWGIANPEGMKCGKAGRGDLRLSLIHI